MLFSPRGTIPRLVLRHYLMLSPLGRGAVGLTGPSLRGWGSVSSGWRELTPFAVPAWPKLDHRCPCTHPWPTRLPAASSVNYDSLPLQYKWLVFGKMTDDESTRTDVNDFQVSAVEESHGWLRCWLAAGSRWWEFRGMKVHGEDFSVSPLIHSFCAIDARDRKGVQFSPSFSLPHPSNITLGPVQVQPLPQRDSIRGEHGVMLSQPGRSLPGRWHRKKEEYMWLKGGRKTKQQASREASKKVEEGRTQGKIEEGWRLYTSVNLYLMYLRVAWTCDRLTCPRSHKKPTVNL